MNINPFTKYISQSKNVRLRIMNTYVENAGTIDIRWFISLLDSITVARQWKIKEAKLDDYHYIIPDSIFMAITGLSDEDIDKINESLLTCINGYIVHDNTTSKVYIAGSLNNEVAFFTHKEGYTINDVR